MTDEEIYDAIARWHVAPEDGVPLHEHLGMTWEEYTRWVTKWEQRAL